jgi:hypothetical protein
MAKLQIQNDSVIEISNLDIFVICYLEFALLYCVTFMPDSVSISAAS